MKRWSKKVAGGDIFKLDKIFWPVNLGNTHWTCLVAYMQEKKIIYYDSFGGAGSHYLEGTLRYFQDEWKAKGKEGDFNPEEWTLEGTPDHYPQQKNGFDCGVFTTTCADFISQGKECTFDQKDITLYRRTIALKIIEYGT